MFLLKNAWYVAAWAKDVNHCIPLQRQILGEPVVLFRDSSNAPIALANRCPHRFAPLSRGVIRNDAIECPYHGLRFDRTGSCVHNPHGDGRIPPSANIKAYPLMERYGAIWIWMGDPNKISNTSLPAFEYLSERDNEVSVGYLLTRANYQLSADNLLDLSHFQFLHPGTLGSAQMASGSTSTCKEAGDTVWCDRLYRGEFLREFVANAYGIPHGIAVDRRMVVRWDAPGLISIEITVTPSGAPLELGRTSLSGHFLTPESDTATHYFFAFGLPKTMGESAKTLVKYATEGLMTPFEKEDLPMLEAQQLALGNQDFWHAQPLMLPIDSAAIRARRIMARKLDAEARLAA